MAWLGYVPLEDVQDLGEAVSVALYKASVIEKVPAHQIVAEQFRRFKLTPKPYDANAYPPDPLA